MLPPSSRLAMLALVWTACGVGTVEAAPGVTEDAVTFGQSGCFSGTCRRTGLQYRAGILTAFHERNGGGGVNGRELKLIARDDGYEPDRAAVNADWFVTANEVFAVIGGIGTPTARRIAPILRTVGIPFVGHSTGADFLGDTSRYPNVVNVRSQYADEIKLLVAHMFEEMGARRFGIIYQDDSFGRSVLASYETALEAFGLPILAKASYSRQTHAVHASVFIMAKAHLDGVMLATTTEPAADAINTARSLGHDYTVGLLSFVEVDRLTALLDHSNERVLMTRVTPDLTDDNVALVKRFHRALAAYKNAEPEAAEHVADPGVLEGYILGRYVIEVLQRIPGDLTREAFLAAALAPDPVLIDDWVIAFDDGSNVGSDYVRLIDLAGYDSAEEAAK